MLSFPLFGQQIKSVDLASSFDFINSVSNRVGFPSDTKESRFSYRLGINVNFYVFDQVQLKAGLSYVRLSHVGDRMQTFADNTDFNTMEIFDVVFNEHYVAIPVAMRFETKVGKKLTVFMEAGVAPHFYLKGTYDVKHKSSVSTSNNSLIERIPSYIGNASENFEIPYLKDTRMRMGFQLGFGTDIQLSAHHRFYIQPNFRYYSAANIRDPLPTDPGGFSILNMGVEFGVRRLLGHKKQEEEN